MGRGSRQGAEPGGERAKGDWKFYVPETLQGDGRKRKGMWGSRPLPAHEHSACHRAAFQRPSFSIWRPLGDSTLILAVLALPLKYSCLLLSPSFPLSLTYYSKASGFKRQRVLALG